MTKQEEFKAEMAAIFKKYNVEMTVVETTRGHYTYASGIKFDAQIKIFDEKGEFSHYEIIDFKVGTWVDSDNFE